MTLSKGTLLATLALILASAPAVAQKQYSPGASDTEIKIGTTHALQRPGIGLFGRRGLHQRLLHDDQ